MAGSNFFHKRTNPDGNTEYVSMADENNDVSVCRGLTKPTDGEAGYAPGCIFVDTDASATAVLYLNESSNTSCDFNVINPAASSSVVYNAIGDAAANGSIQFAGYTGTYTSTTANWGGLIVTNTHANPTAGASLLNLDYTANGDAHGVFIDCTDNTGADSKFLVGLDGATVIAGTATGTDALTLTAGDLTITDGDVTFTTGDVLVSAGDIDIAADSKKVSFGAAGDTDSYIHFDGAGNLVFYDSTVAVEKTLTQLTTGIGSDPTLTGNVTITDGKLTWTDAADEVAGAWTFAGTTNNDITWTSKNISADCLAITANDLTSGSMIYLESSAASMAGEYIRCYDGAADDFVVGANGNIAIAGSGDAITVTTGTLQLTDGDIDMDEGKIEVNSTSDETSYFIRNNSGASTAVVEIEDTHSTGTGTGLLVDVNSAQNSKGIEISHDGDLAALEIGAGAARTGNVINIPMANMLAQTALDITGAVTGTAGEGIIHVDVTGALAGNPIRLDSTGANLATGQLLYALSSGNQGAATDGICGYFEDTGSAAATSYCVYISSTSNEALHVDAGLIQFDEALTIGVDAAGADLTVFGATTNKYMIWDASADDMILTDATGLIFGGTEGSADGVKFEFDGTDTLDINAVVAGDHIAIGDATQTGFTIAAASVTPNDAAQAASVIPHGATAVDVQAVTNDVNDWIVLPVIADVPVGHTIRIACNAGGAFELRTVAASNVKINGVDSDGTQEYACTDTEMITVTKVSDGDGWVATALSALGAVVTAVIPD